jgi:hypothetical protein
MGAIVPKRIQVKPTLRGLVVTNHKKNPPERVGEVIPYTGLRWLQLGCVSWGAKVNDAPTGAGSEYVVRGERGFHIALRAQRRSLWRAIRRGEISPEFKNALNWKVLLTIGGMTIGYGALGVSWVLYQGGSFSAFASDRAADDWARGGLAMSITMMLFGCAVLLPSLAVTLKRDHFVQLTRDGVVVKARHDAGRLLRWEQLVSVSRIPSGYVLDFGSLGRVRPARGEHSSVFCAVLDPNRERERSRSFGRLASIAVLATGVVVAFAPLLFYGSFVVVGGLSYSRAVVIWAVVFAALFWRGTEPWERLGLRCRGVYRGWRRRWREGRGA